MKLEAYLTEKDITPYQFAKGLGVAPTMVYRWLGGAVPTAKYLSAIFDETDERVGPKDFLNGD